MNKTHEQARKRKIIKDFRLYAGGRLYWKNQNNKSLDWQPADIARVKYPDGTKVTFTSYEEIEAHIIDCLAYPDDRWTRDFSNGRAERKKKAVRHSYLKFSVDEIENEYLCPRCGELTYLRVVVDITQDDGGQVHETFKKCLTCQLTDNAILAQAYWYTEHLHELPF